MYTMTSSAGMYTMTPPPSTVAGHTGDPLEVYADQPASLGHHYCAFHWELGLLHPAHGPPHFYEERASELYIPIVYGTGDKMALEPNQMWIGKDSEIPGPRDVLDYPLDAAGILAAFPYILMAVVVQVRSVIFLMLINDQTSADSNTWHHLISWFFHVVTVNQLLLTRGKKCPVDFTTWDSKLSWFHHVVIVHKLTPNRGDS